MSGIPWTDEENDLIVEDYFAMLSKDVAGRDYTKTAHRRALISRLENRSEAAIEFKHQNISAALRDLGEDWIHGYRPARNYQGTLADAVMRWLDQNPKWISRTPANRPAFGTPASMEIPVGPPPTLSNGPPPENLDRMIQTATNAIGHSVEPARSGLWRMNEQHCMVSAGTTSRARCDGSRRNAGTARAMTFPALSRTGDHA